MPLPISLIVDSGAYSAWTQGKEVSLENYTNFLLQNQPYITANVNLDVINPEDPEPAAAAGWRNFQYMSDRGLKVMPVFHARENMKWLDKMMNAVDYIGLSGTSLVSPIEHMFWYHLVWQYATDNKGRALAKFHAFGDTAINSMLTFPWYSVDSATWMIAGGRAARISLQGKAYQLRSSMIGDSSIISDSDPLPQRQAWQHEMRELGVDPELIMKLKCTRAQMAMIRSYINAAGLLKVKERTAGVTTYKARPTLLSYKRSLTGGKKREGPGRFYFVISPSAWYFNYPILAMLNITDILVSYYYVTNAPPSFWNDRLVPFLHDPQGFIESHPKLRQHWDKLSEVVLKSDLAVK